MCRVNYYSIIISFVFFVFMVSCEKQEISPILTANKHIETIIQTKIPIPDTHFQLVNPYKLQIMQVAAESLYSLGLIPEPILLIPTHKYIKFHPRDSSDYNQLINSGIELFDHPLDSLVTEDYFSQSDSLYTAPQMRPQFASIPTNISIPSVPYVLIDDCYIPEEDELQIRSADGDRLVINYFPELMELLANQIANPGFKLSAMESFPLGERIASVRSAPAGCLTLATDDPGVVVPLKGVKVRVNSFVKTDTAYTDEYGNYSMTLVSTKKL